MSKRKKKGSADGEQSPEELAAEQNGSIGTNDRLRSAVFGGRSDLHRVRLACGNLKRIKAPGPDHVMKFVERVFEIAGVERT